jgi:hypothetical protein
MVSAKIQAFGEGIADRSFHWDSHVLHKILQI